MPITTDIIRLIDLAYERKSKFLDLSHLEFIKLPARIKKLAPFLEGLNLGKYKKLESIKYSKNINRIKKSRQLEFFQHIVEYLPNLQVLHISNGQVGDQGAEVLSQLTKLIFLDVSNNQIGISGAIAISQLKNLRTLNIKGNKIWSNGAQAISELSDLRILHISSNMIGPAGARAIGTLRNLHTLHIDDNQIRDGGAADISRLHKLHTLDLSYNQITSDGLQSISQIKQLVYLNISHNQINSEGIEVIDQLQSLQTLLISHNQIRSEGVKIIGKINELRALDVSSNQIIYDDTFSINRLINLHTLSISDNQLLDVGAQAISELNKLRILHISSNMIGPAGARAIGTLKNLHTLHIDDNQIRDGGAADVGKLFKLNTLNISSNEITALGAFPISKLSSLHYLDISDNKIKDGGAKYISRLINLRFLNIRSNEISDDGAKAIGEIKHLTYLDIRINQISDFPIESFRSLILGSMEELFLEKNPIINLPISNLDDVQALRSYILSTQTVNELIKNTYVKINLLGTEEVGKTEWTRFLSSNEYKVDQDRTHGIEHKEWSFKSRDNQTYTASIWDFGGQEYYHGTHHLFLRKSHFYIILWTRNVNQENNKIKPDDYPYWLGNVRHFAPDAPLILLQNKCDKYSMHYPDSEVIEDYNVSPENISFISVEGAFNKNPKWSLLWRNMKATLQYSLQEYAQKITLNQKWIKARKKINNAGKNTIFLNLKEFRQLTSIELDQEDGFISYLEFVGDALHFKEVELLKDKIFINPINLSIKIYQLFSRDIKQKKRGVFDKIHLEEQLDNTEKADVFLEVMKQFHLVFHEPGGIDRFVIPQYLPEYAHSFMSTLLLLLPFAFELMYPDFLHEGLIFRFIAKYGVFAKDNTAYWKYGLLFTHPETQLKTIVYYIKEKRKIKIHIEDKQGKSQVAQELFYYFAFQNSSNETGHLLAPSIEYNVNVDPKEDIQIKNLNYQRLVPTIIDWSTLYPRLILSTDGAHKLRVKDTHDNVINNVFFGHCISTNKRIKLDYMTQNLLSNPSDQRKLRVFFSYSHKDEIYRDELERHFSMLKRGNLIETWHDRKITPGNDWDTTIKDNIENADIVLLLLSSDFLSSEYIWENELGIIRRRLADKPDKIKVVPIFLRSCDLTDFDQMAYQGLPADKDWILSKKWPYPDEAYLAVAAGLRKLLDTMSKQP